MTIESSAMLFYGRHLEPASKTLRTHNRKYVGALNGAHYLKKIYYLVTDAEVH